MLRRGYVYWAHIDKRRPALVLSPDSRNEGGSDVIVVPITTNLRRGPWHVRLKRGEGGLQAPSVLRCEWITTLPREDVEPTALGGPLSVLRLREVKDAVLRAIGWV